MLDRDPGDKVREALVRELDDRPAIGRIIEYFEEDPRRISVITAEIDKAATDLRTAIGLPRAPGMVDSLLPCTAGLWDCLRGTPIPTLTELATETEDPGRAFADILSGINLAIRNGNRQSSGPDRDVFRSFATQPREMASVVFAAFYAGCLTESIHALEGENQYDVLLPLLEMSLLTKDTKLPTTLSRVAGIIYRKFLRESWLLDLVGGRDDSWYWHPGSPFYATEHFEVLCGYLPRDAGGLDTQKEDRCFYIRGLTDDATHVLIRGLGRGRVDALVEIPDPKALKIAPDQRIGLIIPYSLDSIAALALGKASGRIASAGYIPSVPALEAGMPEKVS